MCPHCGISINAAPVILERRLGNNEIRCPNCGYIGVASRVSWDVSGCLITVILLCCFFIPGIIYMIYRDGVAATECCPKCGNTNIAKG